MISNKKLDEIVTELFIRGKKLNIFTVFIVQSYFVIPKDVRRNCTHLRKFQINKRCNKLYLTLHQILSLKTL